MGYVVRHGHAKAESTEAFQVYGSVVMSDMERQRLIQCIKAAIERRVSEGPKIEVCTTYRIGLLADITRIFCENNLRVTRAQLRWKHKVTTL
ncbi:putative ACT domain-containing protein ACR1-12 [Helianthus annuus]|uniref:ACT domain-containing protein ACR n=1 Tax=Helianthus annuus TaxID=4232 RepID=A0A9K3HVM7_HELAN|nr:putative ACT domain-containing protein ACR1-12 [Helianthus annuus]